MTCFDWTDDTIDKLKAYWGDGLSASQCQYRMNKDFGAQLTRSAIIGKIHRLGIYRGKTTLSNTSTTPRPQKPRRPKHANGYAGVNFARRLAAQDPGLETTEAPDLPPDVADNPVTLLELSDTTCRWPIGSPTDHDNFHFCGGQPTANSPYCIRHHRQAHRPSHASGKP